MAPVDVTAAMSGPGHAGLVVDRFVEGRYPTVVHDCTGGARSAARGTLAGHESLIGFSNHATSQQRSNLQPCSVK